MLTLSGNFECCKEVYIFCKDVYIYLRKSMRFSLKYCPMPIYCLVCLQNLILKKMLVVSVYSTLYQVFCIIVETVHKPRGY